ncbi:acyl-CoA dehydrogenase family protein [Streptomyces gobiensis]|uniref:acyl-CoA dehydrogenase family protein n=1 Tax=Streptomyces gobiensis TaxID=2875706 RepID=UPI001E2E3B03|nr:acyl-CoA dehydrogenase family protein [Streptomyces gobiensis]UGY94516.1 acyl-CoA dehydrogenase family protein [Streptomyces gobiensis]
MVDLTPTEEQRHIQAAAADLLAARSREAGARAVRAEPAGYSAELWKEMTGLGWPGLALPEEYGGADGGFLELCLLFEELGRHQVPSPLLTTMACAALPIARHGSAAQRAQWLRAVAQGRTLSYVRAAPRGDWNATGSDVVAEPAGQGFRLHGTALFVPYAGTADALLVIARTGGPEELTALLVDNAPPGVRCERLDVVGNDPHYRVDFTAVTVPGERAVGAVGSGRTVAGTAAELGAAATCAEMAGGAQGVLDMTVGHARRREQFGRPIGSFQAVQHHCANMAVDVLGSRLGAYESIWRLSQGLPATMEVSLAKAWGSEAYQRVCALGHQVHGAIGFTYEHDLHFFHRHAVASALAFGDADHHIARVTRYLGL